MEDYRSKQHEVKTIGGNFSNAQEMMEIGGAKPYVACRMKFHEKLRARVQELGINKAKAAREVGLPDSTISSYLSKETSLPRIDIALKIARALKVPLEWLADDDAPWPPPDVSRAVSVHMFSDGQLLEELTRRYRRAVIDFLEESAKAMSFDWRGASQDAEAAGKSGKSSPRAERAEKLLRSIEAKFNRIGSDFDVEIFSMLHHDHLPGDEKDLETLTRHSVNEAWAKLRDIPDLRRFAGIARERTNLIESDTRQADDEQEMRARVHAHLVSNQRPKSNEDVKSFLRASRKGGAAGSGK